MKEIQLSSVHKSLGAEIDSFAGWRMPIKYDRVKDEHMAVREKLGLFDISHMGEIRVTGSDSEDFLKIATTNNVSELEVGSAHYSVILNEKGGTKDDVFVYRLGDEEFVLVVNASNVDKIFNWFTKKSTGDVKVRDITSETVMFALQGPESREVLQGVVEYNLEDFEKFSADWMEVAGVECLVSRSGYTGEDGFEIYVFDQASGEADESIEILNKLLENGESSGIKPCGLAARDSLRLEAGFPLYGHELNEEITPIEAKIEFVLDFEKEFLGRKKLLEQKREGVSRERIGFVMEEGGIPRKDYGLFLDDEKIGEVTSGGFSPVLETGIGMGYALPDLALGREVFVDIRGRRRKAIIEDWPFF